MSYNIKQLTERNIGKTKDDDDYKVPNTISEDGTQCTFNLAEDNGVVIKLGYVCEPKGIKLPIKINGKEIEIGKSGIYEGQSETYWLFTAKAEASAEIKVETVTVPTGIKFTLDYVLS